MAINTVEEFEKVLNISWYTHDQPIENLRFVICLSYRDVKLIFSSYPCVLPFSQMYPLCCVDIRNFLNQFYFFSDDQFQHAEIIDETLRQVLRLICFTLNTTFDTDLGCSLLMSF